MKYPFWLPKPRRHWLRAIEVGLLSIPVCLIFYIVLMVGGAISMTMLVSLHLFSVWMLLWLGALLLVPPVLFAHFHQFLWDDPKPNLPKWLPRPRCLRRGAINWLVFILAVTISLILWIDWSIIQYGSDRQIQMHLEARTPLLNISWVISAAYLFFLGDGIGWFLNELVKLAFALVGKKK